MLGRSPLGVSCKAGLGLDCGIPVVRRAEGAQEMAAVLWDLPEI